MALDHDIDGHGHPYNVVETSPDGKYLRYDVQLGRGAFREMYKAFDTEDAIEVAWNTVSIGASPQEREKLRLQVSILKSLDHPNIIAFHNSWVDPATESIVFITELMASGTLKQYIHRTQKISLKVIKKWCRQILTALKYMHEREPPVIHRDLKCDNIFINGNSADVKIGDLGLATFMPRSYPQSVIGTPEFMAPELCDDNYNEKVDIWSFGMCVLEMITREYPYIECQNAAQIFKKVSAGKLPAALDRITDPEVRAFISSCLCPASARKSAADLLMDNFLREDCEEAAAMRMAGDSPQGDSTSQAAVLAPPAPLHSHPYAWPPPSASTSAAISNMRVIKVSGSKAKLKLRMPSDSSAHLEIGFEYDLEADSPDTVAAELLQEETRCPYDQAQIASEIRRILSQIRQDHTGDRSSSLPPAGQSQPSSDRPPRPGPPLPPLPPLPPRPAAAAGSFRARNMDQKKSTEDSDQRAAEAEHRASAAEAEAATLKKELRASKDREKSTRQDAAEVDMRRKLADEAYKTLHEEQERLKCTLQEHQEAKAKLQEELAGAVRQSGWQQEENLRLQRMLWAQQQANAQLREELVGAARQSGQQQEEHERLQRALREQQERLQRELREQQEANAKLREELAAAGAVRLADAHLRTLSTAQLDDLADKLYEALPRVARAHREALRRETGVRPPTPEPSQCFICLERPVQATLLPCGHTKMCLICADRLVAGTRKCPDCRQHIVQRVRVYL